MENDVIMVSRLNQLIGLLLLSVSLIACAANPLAEPTAAITEHVVGTETAALISVQIVPGASENRVISEEPIPLDNCNGNVPLTSTIERSRSVFHVAEIGTSAELNVAGSLGVSGVGTVEVGSAIAQHYNVTYGEEEKVSHSVSVSAKEGSYIVHTVQQFETWETGDLVIFAGGEEAAREPYSFRKSFGVEVIDIKSINDCETSSSENGESQSGPLPTYTAFPTYTPYPTYTPVPDQQEPIATSTPEHVPTDTPLSVNSQVFEVEGETATWSPLETGLYIQSGDRVLIEYISGEWWIGQRLNNSWQAQTPTDADGYTDREGERVSALLGVDNPNICRPLVSAPFGSLVGSLGEDGALFLIGSGTDFIAQDSGILYLRMNYYTHNRVTNCPYGEGGTISVRVTITIP